MKQNLSAEEIRRDLRICMTPGSRCRDEAGRMCSIYCLRPGKSCKATLAILAKERFGKDDTIGKTE